MDFYCTKTSAARNLNKLFDIYRILKYDIDDEKIYDATKKAILTIFNKYGEKVYNKTENSFYKRIMYEKSKYCNVECSYRYYPNGLVYYIYFGNNKNNIEEEYALFDGSNLGPTLALKEYKVPISFEKKIEANKEKIKEIQLKAISEQKEKEARRKAIADRKKAKKVIETEKPKNPYLTFLDEMGYSSRNIHSNFIRYQLSKWYKDINKPIVPKIFRDNLPLYKIMEKLNQINEDINLKTVKDIHYEYQAKNNRDDLIYEWGSTNNILGKYPVMAYLNTIHNEIDTLIEDKICKNYTYLFQFIIDGFGCNKYTRVLWQQGYTATSDRSIITRFVLIKDKKTFETIKAEKPRTLYNNSIILDKPKYLNEVDVKLSDECLYHHRKTYRHGIYDGKNIIAFPFLAMICESWPIFIKKVKECEYGEEWLERVGFIPPKDSKEAKK